MSALFASGALIDLVLVVALVEGIALSVFHRATGKGVAPQEFGANLVAGLLLMLAVRNVLVGTWWGWTALCLMGSGAAHGADLRRRWKH